MRRALLACGLVGGIVLDTAGCVDRSPMAESKEERAEQSVGRTAGRPAFGHPAGIVERVEASEPWGVAVRDDGLTYFTSLEHAAVGVTSTRTRTIAGYIPTGRFPTGVAFSPDGGAAYVASQDQSVTVIDVASGKSSGTLRLDVDAFAVQVSPDGTQLYVGTASAALLTIDLVTRTLIRSIDVGVAPNAFAVSPDKRLLYVSSFVDGSVAEIDMASGATRRTFAVGGMPQGMALNRRGSRLYVGNESGYLNDIDLRTGQSDATIPLAGGAFGVGVTPDDNQAYITIPARGLVQVFNLQSRRLHRTINVGGDPRRVAFSQRGRLSAITNTAGYLTFVR